MTCLALLAAAVAVAGARCSVAPRPDARVAAAAGGGAWFVETGCTACHPVTVYGLWSPAVNAPDLSIAVEDVPRRFGRSMDDFIRAPTGTMAMVLSGKIILDDAGRSIAIDQLKRAYELHRQASDPGRPRPSH